MGGRCNSLEEWEIVVVMHYQLDIGSLLGIFSTQPIDWMLESQAPTYYIRITLLHGKIASCLFRQEEDKVTLEGETALQAIHRLGRISWTVTRVPPGQDSSTTVTEASPSRTNSRPLVSGPSSVMYNPYLAVPAKTALLLDVTRFPRLIQHIFFLVDGQKNVQQIAQLVGRTPEEVLGVLQRMREGGMITL